MNWTFWATFLALGNALAFWRSICFAAGESNRPGIGYRSSKGNWRSRICASKPMKRSYGKFLRP